MNKTSAPLDRFGGLFFVAVYEPQAYHIQVSKTYLQGTFMQDDLYWEHLHSYWSIRLNKMKKQLRKLQTEYGCVIAISRLQADISIISEFVKQLESRYESLAS